MKWIQLKNSADDGIQAKATSSKKIPQLSIQRRKCNYFWYTQFQCHFMVQLHLDSSAKTHLTFRRWEFPEKIDLFIVVAFAFNASIFSTTTSSVLLSKFESLLNYSSLSWVEREFSLQILLSQIHFHAIDTLHKNTDLLLGFKYHPSMPYQNRVKHRKVSCKKAAFSWPIQQAKWWKGDFLQVFFPRKQSLPKRINVIALFILFLEI